MTTSRTDIRRQVLAQFILVMEQAVADGQDPYAVAEATFPGTPSEVLCRAEMNLNDRQEERWWLSIERTIDAEVIQAAIAGPANKPVPAGSRDAHLDEAFAALTETGADERRGR